MRIEISEQMFEVHSFGAQSIFKYGICNEINVIGEASKVFPDEKFTRLLIVEGRHFFFDQKGGKIVEQGSSSAVEVSISNLPEGDEKRVEALLNLIGIETNDDKNLDQFFVISFGNEIGTKDCTDCWTDRGCALTFCGTSCSWSSGCSY